MRNRNPLRAATVAATVAAVLSMTAPAMAATKPHPPIKPKPVKVQRFTARGLVVASTPKTLRVITRQMQVGATNLPANTVVTVKRPATRGKAGNDSLVGYAVTVTGTAVKLGKSTILTANHETVAARPAEVFLGEVTDVTAGRLTLEAVSAAGGADFGEAEQTLTVDISTATSTVDGDAGAPVEGEFAVVLGEREEDTIVAATVDGWTEAPDVVAGEITDVSGSVLTLDNGWQGSGPQDGEDSMRVRSPRHDELGDQPGDETPGDGNPGDGNPGDGNPGDGNPGEDMPGDDNPGDDDPTEDSPTTVDLAPGGIAVPVVLNGGVTVDPETLIAGERLVVLGETADDGAFTPTVAFAFDENNHYPAGRHHHHHRD